MPKKKKKKKETRDNFSTFLFLQNLEVTEVIPINWLTCWCFSLNELLSYENNDNSMSTFSVTRTTIKYKWCQNISYFNDVHSKSQTSKCTSTLHVKCTINAVCVGYGFLKYLAKSPKLGKNTCKTKPMDILRRFIFRWCTHKVINCLEMYPRQWKRVY